jgi:hypothetical protein
MMDAHLFRMAQGKSGGLTGMVEVSFGEWGNYGDKYPKSYRLHETKWRL